MDTTITARPASLAAYRDVARDAATDLAASGRDLAHALASARAGAVDVAVPVDDLDVETLELSEALEGLGERVGRVGEAFAALDAEGPTARTTERALMEELGPWAHVGGAWTFVGGVLSANAVRVPLELVGAGVLAQRTIALTEMARAWLRRAWLRVTAPLRAVAAGLHHLRAGAWRTALPAYRHERALGQRAVGEQSRRLHTALRGAREGWGIVGHAGRILGPVGVVGDGYTAWTGSPYDGARGTIDRSVAVGGFAAGGALVLAGLGVVTLGPVLATGAVITAAGAALWGVGNFAWDHRHTIADWGRSGARAVGNAASAVGDAASSAASAAGDAASSAASVVGDAASSAVSSVDSSVRSAGDGVRRVGRVLGFTG